MQSVEMEGAFFPTVLYHPRMQSIERGNEGSPDSPMLWLVDAIIGERKVPFHCLRMFLIMELKMMYILCRKQQIQPSHVTIVVFQQSI
jgi:hypothetical protein